MKIYKIDDLNDLPDTPGIYFMKDKDDQVIYVGKSKHLKTRVRSYFFKGAGHSRKIKRMIKNISHVNIIRTDTEFDALLLECRYIHDIKPMYNTLLKNYEKYKYICLSEKNHNIIDIKNDIDSEDIYFGPYSFGHKMDTIKEILVKVYKLPTCQRMTKCIRYDLNKCIAPCRNQICEDKKQSIIKSIEENLNGKDGFVVYSLKKEMNSKIKDLNFEEAAVIKDQMDLFSSIVKNQKSLLKLNKNVVFWIKIDKFRYKVYYISRFEVKYEKILNVQNLEEVEKVKSEIRGIISKQTTCKIPIKKEEIDYINIVNEYIKNSEDMGYIVVNRKGD